MWRYLMNPSFCEILKCCVCVFLLFVNNQHRILSVLCRITQHPNAVKVFVVIDLWRLAGAISVCACSHSSQLNPAVWVWGVRESSESCPLPPTGFHYTTISALHAWRKKEGGGGVVLIQNVHFKWRGSQAHNLQNTFCAVTTNYGERKKNLKQTNTTPNQID